MKKPFNKRAIASLILLFSLVMLPVSGVIIHIGHGTKTGHTWLHLHVVIGIVFVVAAVFHVIYNWKVLKQYLIGKK